jgi:hypothetical protein
MTAVYDRKLQVCRYLTQIGADINIRYDNNDTAIHFDAASDSVDIISCCWIQECLLTWPTNITQFYYMFQSHVAVWKETNSC